MDSKVTVHIVLAWDDYYPSPHNMQGVYSTREAALERVFEVANSGSWDHVDIVTKEVDPEDSNL